MTTLSSGAMAPRFSLSCDDSTTFDLAAERGHYVILFFYPKDNTPGCSTENCDFSDLSGEFAQLNVALVGISPDSNASHLKFRAKYGLKTRLIADPDHVAIDAYGVWGEKQMAGRHYMGLIRTTVIIAPDGTIADIVTVKRVKDHAADMLARVRELIAAS